MDLNIEEEVHNMNNMNNQNMYAQHFERPLKEEAFDRSLLPELLNIDNRKLTKDDDETNNGPLDFSLHRVQDMLFNGEKPPESLTPRPTKPRVKVTERETPEQRERRLVKGRERMRNLRANESFEERQIRLIKARQCQQRRREKERLTETTEERELRLQKARERTRLRRSMETQEQRDLRLQATRDRVRMKRHSESPEERQRRLLIQRTRKKEKYQQLTAEEKEMLRGGEKVVKRYKNDSKVDKRQTRGINIKYNTFEEDLDEALLKFQSETQHMTNDSEDASWLAEPEVCLSVGSLDVSENKGKDEEQTTNGAGASRGSQSNVGSPSLPSRPPQTPAQSQSLEEQLSKHISNVAMNISSSSQKELRDSLTPGPSAHSPLNSSNDSPNNHSIEAIGNNSRGRVGNQSLESLSSQGQASDHSSMGCKTPGQPDNPPLDHVSRPHPNQHDPEPQTLGQDQMEALGQEQHMSSQQHLDTMNPGAHQTASGHPIESLSQAHSAVEVNRPPSAANHSVDALNRAQSINHSIESMTRGGSSQRLESQLESMSRGGVSQRLESQLESMSRAGGNQRLESELESMSRGGVSQRLESQLESMSRAGGSQRVESQLESMARGGGGGGHSGNQRLESQLEYDSELPVRYASPNDLSSDPSGAYPSPAPPNHDHDPYSSTAPGDAYPHYAAHINNNQSQSGYMKNNTVSLPSHLANSEFSSYIRRQNERYTFLPPQPYSASSSTAGSLNPGFSGHEPQSNVYPQSSQPSALSNRYSPHDPQIGQHQDSDIYNRFNLSHCR